MIPKRENIVPDFEVVGKDHESSLTYKVSGGRIVGFVDGLDAMKQSVERMLKTERFKYLIYSFDYGTEKTDIRLDEDFYKSETKRLITEALMQDDRVVGVLNFVFERLNPRTLLVNFTVETVFGEIKASQEVQGV